MNQLYLVITLLLTPLAALPAADAPQPAAQSRIDRHALVTRHNIVITDFDATCRATGKRRCRSATGTLLSDWM